MKIKFVSNGLCGEVNKLQLSSTAINPAFFFLKAYYMLHGLNPNVTWLPCDFIMVDTLETQVSNIVAESPDLIGLSVYVWNEDYQFDLARRLKEVLPNSIIVLGGPQLIAHKDPEFFNKHPYVDYVCYGDGEEAFQLLIDRVSGYLPADSELVNMVENTSSGYKLWPLKILTDELYLGTSSFLIQKQEVIDSISRLESQGIPKNKIIFAIEFARGCMYKCSFCDWSQNLTKKVKRRTHDWRAELDFFKEIDLVLRETDANFGQWPEDIEIFDYGVSLYDPTRNFKFRVHNTPKLKKEATYYLQMTQAKIHGFRVHVALQDINDSVLANINRPSIPWPEQRSMIQQMQRELPDDKKHLLGVQLISGLPGQTYNSIVDMLLELYRTGVRQIVVNLWAYLDNSPASDIHYQKLHKLEWIDAYFLVTPTLEVTDLKTLYSDLATKTINPQQWTKLKIVKEHSSMKIKDLMKAQLFRQYFNVEMQKLGSYTMTESELIDLKDTLNAQVQKEVEHTFEHMGQLVDDHNIITFASYADNKFTPIYAD
jgi:hypothetical protein